MDAKRSRTKERTYERWVPMKIGFCNFSGKKEWNSGVCIYTGNDSSWYRISYFQKISWLRACYVRISKKSVWLFWHSLRESVSFTTCGLKKWCRNFCSPTGQVRKDHVMKKNPSSACFMIDTNWRIGIWSYHILILWAKQDGDQVQGKSSLRIYMRNHYWLGVHGELLNL